MPNNVVKRVQSFVRNQFNRLLASDLVPEGAADTTTNFVFSNFVLLSTEAPTLPVQQDMM